MYQYVLKFIFKSNSTKLWILSIYFNDAEAEGSLCVRVHGTVLSDGCPAI